MGGIIAVNPLGITLNPPSLSNPTSDNSSTLNPTSDDAITKDTPAPHTPAPHTPNQPSNKITSPTHNPPSVSTLSDEVPVLIPTPPPISILYDDGPSPIATPSSTSKPDASLKKFRNGKVSSDSIPNKAVAPSAATINSTIPINKILFKISGDDIITSNPPRIQPSHDPMDPKSFKVSGDDNITSNPPQIQSPIKVPYLYLQIPKRDYKFSWQRESKEPSISIEYDDVASSAPAPTSPSDEPTSSLDAVNQSLNVLDEKRNMNLDAKMRDSSINSKVLTHDKSSSNAPHIDMPQQPINTILSKASGGNSIVSNAPPIQSPQHPTIMLSFKANGGDSIGSNEYLLKEIIYSVIMAIMICVGTYCVLLGDGLLSGDVGLPDGDGLLNREGLGLPDGAGLLSGGLGVHDERSIGDVLCELDGDGCDLSDGNVSDVMDDGGALGRLLERLLVECVVSPIGGLTNELVSHEMVFYEDTMYDDVPTDRDKNEVIVLLGGVLKDRDKNLLTGELLRERAKYNMGNYEVDDDALNEDVLKERNKDGLIVLLCEGLKGLSMCGCGKHCKKLYERDKANAESLARCVNYACDTVDTGSPVNADTLAALLTNYGNCGTEPHKNDAGEAVSTTNGDPLVYNYNYFIRYLCAVVKTLTCAEQIASLDAVASITEAAINARLYQINNSDILYIGYGYDGHGLNSSWEKNIKGACGWISCVYKEIN